ncbi:hypothetical protein NDU88_006634 [Pleurodeles waltl]|uniref:Uncharacterized protein n=1 Tax=Pleurodeles waltl TaxID=8319 RepID=A0AAV7SQF5_PLEWA|nr:hypothetical protein NDU88_006634 [Pleurodeles waltl]
MWPEAWPGRKTKLRVPESRVARGQESEWPNPREAESQAIRLGQPRQRTVGEGEHQKDLETAGRAAGTSGTRRHLRSGS